MKRLEALSDKPIMAKHRGNTSPAEGWVDTTVQQLWLIMSMLQVKYNTFNNKFPTLLKEMSQYLRKQCKPSHCRC